MTMLASRLRDKVLLRLLRDPQAATGFSVGEWEALLREARATRLGGRVWHLLTTGGIADRAPEPIGRRLAAKFLAAEYDRGQLLWEIDRVRRSLGVLRLPTLLLKGAAYAAAGLDIAFGRVTADIDIMVPFDDLASAEYVLMWHGWEHVVDDPYDQRYYRQWMHELPPLRHDVRESELDLHHAIVPRTGRLRPDMARVIAAAVTIDAAGTRVLAPADMVLHCIVHLFQDGEISGALRDLVDIDFLLRHFGAQPGFWSALRRRTDELGLQRPVFYALRYSEALLDTPVDDVGRSATGSPTRAVLALMDRIVPASLVPPSRSGEHNAARIGAFCLYLRSHWLRMSPRRLALHLARKAIRRWNERRLRQREQEQEA